MSGISVQHLLDIQVKPVCPSCTYIYCLSPGYFSDIFLSVLQLKHGHCPVDSLVIFVRSLFNSQFWFSYGCWWYRPWNLLQSARLFGMRTVTELERSAFFKLRHFKIPFDSVRSTPNHENVPIKKILFRLENRWVGFRKMFF